MNFAVASILIVLIIAPGLIMSRGFFSAPFTKRILPSNPVNELISAILPSVVLHALYLVIVQNWTDYQVDFPLLGNLLFSSSNPDRIKESFSNLSTFFVPIAIYHIVLWAVAYLLGLIGRVIIRFGSLDINLAYFRFNNKWHYIFSGEITRFPDVQRPPITRIDMRVVDMLVDTADGSIIYSGILQDYSLNNNAELDSLTLSHVFRRPLTEEVNGKNDAGEEVLVQAQSQRKYKVPGALMVIPYSKVVNINLHYAALNRPGEIQIGSLPAPDLNDPDLITHGDIISDMDEGQNAR
ncbi:hypothetical protein [Pontibacter fetidus]|uniref:Uncharacterized protein n=1 Tax=Pontibacter fetidus TaxID=2700082 RepID=A0A6B2GY38_9BACT|nr:hypothetical protein [Pontibacter fetidus]NDK54778.1 hypothetical protein [Pontibacter fetidus]